MFKDKTERLRQYHQSQSVKGTVVQWGRLSVSDSDANGTLQDKTKMAPDKMLVYEQSGHTTN